MNLSGPPILTCAETGTFEKQLFNGREELEWPAMQAAGRAVASAVLDDFREIGGFPSTGRVLVLVGKGNNGGDALIAAQAVLEKCPAARAVVVFAFGERDLRPLAARAWRELVEAAPGRVEAKGFEAAKAASGDFDLSLDGVFGFQFHPPLPAPAAAVLAWANALPVRLRAAVDLPSGIDAPDAFKADFTYATGTVKTPLLALPSAGRLRYLDLGFWRDGAAPAVQPFATAADRVLTDETLDLLRALRHAGADKRTFGHLFVVGGSLRFPGAVLMTVLAAVRSGAGLVTAFVPEPLVPAFAARVPEAMWIGCPVTATGGLSPAGLPRMTELAGRATGWLIGPGLGREPETVELIRSLLAAVSGPLVIDADALQPDLVSVGKAPRILTPHAGEFKRIAGGLDLRALSARIKATIVQKGSITRIADGQDKTVWHSFFGGPVLSRGGSGDLLAGLVAAQLAQQPEDLVGSAARGVVWHGRAADLLARARGATAVRTTQLLDYLPAVLHPGHAAEPEAGSP
jgi:NAD(P)H-hydrate epimerase